MFVAGEKMREDFIYGYVRALAELSESFLVGKSAALTAAEVVACEKRTLGTG